MKRKTFWQSLKTKVAKNAGAFEQKNEWIRSQFIELIRLGNSPIVMKMGN